MMLLCMPTSLVDNVTVYLGWRDVLSLGAVSRAATAAASARINTYVEELAEHPAGQGVSLVRALSQSIVLSLSARAVTEEIHEDRLQETGYWGEFSRSGRGGHGLRPRGARQDPRANLLKEHRLLLGRPLYGGMAWNAASIVLGRPPFEGDEWWARPALLEAVAIALKSAHCAFCGMYLETETAEDVIYERGAPSNVRQLCSVCNTAQTGHITRQVKNDMVRLHRQSRRLWKFCTQENPACYNWHHATQDKCDCECHGTTE